MKKPEMFLNEIGCDCFYKALSYSLAYNQDLESMLSFISYDFIYDAESFRTYEFSMEPEKYLCGDNLLYFDGNLRSQLREDYLGYIHKKFESNARIFESVIEISECEMLSPDGIIEWVIDNIKYRAPISILVNQVALRNAYMFKCRKWGHPHTSCEHYINVVDYNEQDDTFWVLDNYFLVSTWIHRETIVEGIRRLEELNIAPSLFIVKKTSEGKNASKKSLIISALDEYMEDNVVIGGKVYSKNGRAIRKLYEDWDQQAKYAQDRYGIYAAQFLSYPYIDFRHQLNSLFILLNRVFKNDSIYKKLIETIEEYNNQWRLFDLLLDKIAIQKKDITLQTGNLKERILRMIQIDSKLQEEACTLIKTMQYIEES